MELFKETISRIKEANNILIISHIGPDGDTIGSTLALADIIKNNFENKNVHFVIQHKIPDIYKFLPNSDKAILTNREVEISCYDLAIGIDCATKKRMGYFEPIYDKAKFKINIDHHETNNSYGDLNHIVGNASSTGEIIFDFTQKMNLTITKEAAICLYTALLTDTGAFRYSNTTSNTLFTASKLIEFGANAHDIYEYCFESRPVEMVKVAAQAIANANFICENKIAYTLVDRKMLSEFGALDEHLEGIPEMLRQADCVEIAFILKETVKNEAKFSFRSKTKDVSKICELFGGGGHKLAAGCIIKTSLEDALNQVLPEIKKLVEK